MKARTPILVVAVVAACCAVAIVVLDRSGAPAAKTASTVRPAPDVNHHVMPAAAPALPVAPAVASVEAPSAETPLLQDDKEYPVDPTPPTREEPLTEEQRDPRARRAIEMLDQAAARAEKDLAAADAAGDEAAATTARVRIKRLHEVRAKRAAELGIK